MNDRFIRIYQQGQAKSTEIWVDTQTGVNYIFMRHAYAGGMTPLLGADGKPVISPAYIRRYEDR